VRRGAPVAALVLAGAALAAAGCGGGGGSSSSSGSGGASTGKGIFTSVGCSNCHTLAAAGAKGQVGPDLDKVRPTFAKAVRQVTHGGGAMPPFSGQLSAAEIRAVARYVSANAGR
jgi:mono/diheme cytochrome c family protein